MVNVWQKYKIGDFLTQTKSIVSIDDVTDYKQVKVRLNNQGVLLRCIKKGSEIATKKQYIVRGGQFIVSRIDARNGAFGLIPCTLEGAIVTGDFPVFTCNTEIISSDYFSYLIKSNILLEACIQSSKGTTNRKRLNENIFLSFEVSLPLLPEQKRIIAKIKDIENIYLELKKNVQHSDDYSKMIFKDYLKSFFSKNNNVLNNWSKIDTLFNILGGTGFPKDYQGTSMGEFPFYKVSDMNSEGNDYYLKKSNNYISRNDAKKLGARIIPSDSLVFPKVGGAIATNKRRLTTLPCIIDNNLMAISPKNSIDPIFLYLFFLSIDLTELQRGSSVPAINQDKVGDIDFPKIGEKQQHFVINKINLIKEKHEELLIEQRRRSLIINAFMPSVLSKAFAGEL